MRFIVFNIVVAAALIYLVADKENRFAMAVPTLDEVSQSAGQLFERSPLRTPPATEPRSETAPPPPAPTQSGAQAASPAEPAADVKPAPPESFVAPPPAPPAKPVPVPDKAPPREVAVAPLAPAAATTPPAAPSEPLDPAVARRRAEILQTDTGVGAPAAPAPQAVQTTPNRRQQLLDLAEEMELLAAENAGR